jgi:phosphatidylserine/phosphatidylglycerophosphate/cardiolipin synthase-like enzyme
MLERDLRNASKGSQSSVPRLEPVGDAVHRKEASAARLAKKSAKNELKGDYTESELLFVGYQESAEDASHLTLGGGGTLLSVMSGKQTQKMGVYLINKATFRIMLTAFTFDLLMITEPLKEAAARGVDVTVIGDWNHTLTGSTAAMVSRFAALRDAGVCVLLTRGVSGTTGIQHSKTLLCDEHIIVGSCNWTNSSRLNQEMSVLLSLNTEGMASYEERVQYLRRHSTPFTEAEEAKGRQHRGARSVPPETRDAPSAEDRYRTAKKYSIARARSASRGAEVAQ